MNINMRFSLLLLPLLAFAITQALVVEVMPPEINSRSFNIPTSLTNVTRYDLVQASSASTRDLDLTARGPSGISTYIENEKRQNLVLAGIYGGIAGGLASGLATSCVIATVLSFGTGCVANIIFFFLFSAAASFFAWTPPNRRSLASDIVWTVDPQYVPTINCSISCNLAASAPRNKFTTFGNVTTEGNFYHLAYYHHSNNTLHGLRVTRNATLSSTASNNKRQNQGDLQDPPGSDGEVDYSAYIYWGDPNLAAFDEYQTDFDNEATNEAVANSYADYVVENDDSIACMSLSESNFAGNELVSLWYFSETPGIEDEAPPDEVEPLMELCNTL